MEAIILTHCMKTLSTSYNVFLRLAYAFESLGFFLSFRKTKNLYLLMFFVDKKSSFF